MNDWDDALRREMRYQATMLRRRMERALSAHFYTAAAYGSPFSTFAEQAAQETHTMVTYHPIYDPTTPVSVSMPLETAVQAAVILGRILPSDVQRMLQEEPLSRGFYGDVITEQGVDSDHSQISRRLKEGVDALRAGTEAAVSPLYKVIITHGGDEFPLTHATEWGDVRSQRYAKPRLFRTYRAAFEALTQVSTASGNPTDYSFRIVKV